MADIEVNYVSKCCGMKELNGLGWFQGNSKEALKSLCERLYPSEKETKARLKRIDDNAKAAGIDIKKNVYGYRYFVNSQGGFDDPLQYSRFRFLAFTEAVGPYNFNPHNPPTEGYGRKFAAFIRAENLGTLVETGWELNPNSGNMLKVWIWGINHDALKIWQKKNTSLKTKVKDAILGVPQGIDQAPQAPAPQRAPNPPVNWDRPAGRF